MVRAELQRHDLECAATVRPKASQHSNRRPRRDCRRGRSLGIKHRARADHDTDHMEHRRTQRRVRPRVYWAGRQAFDHSVPKPHMAARPGRFSDRHDSYRTAALRMTLLSVTTPDKPLPHLK
jgi:hypothetical protein